MGRTSGAAERLRGRIDSEGMVGRETLWRLQRGKWSERQVLLAEENGGNSKQRRWVGLDGWRPLNLQALGERVQVQEPPGRRCCTATGDPTRPLTTLSAQQLPPNHPHGPAARWRLHDGD